MGKKQTVEEQKMISFGRLVFEALPEAWSFQIITSLGLAIISKVIVWMMTSVAEVSGGALTTANIKDLLLSWRAPVLLVLGILLVFCYIAVELLANIYLSGDILEGHRSSIIHELGMGVRSLRRFVTPSGMLVILFIFIAVPLTGIGFSISLTKSFQIPNFIMDVVLANRSYAIGYLIALLFFVWVAYRYCFTLHAVLLDGMSPWEGQKKSAQIMKKHGRSLLFSLIKLYLILALIRYRECGEPQL